MTPSWASKIPRTTTTWVPPARRGAVLRWVPSPIGCIRTSAPRGSIRLASTSSASACWWVKWWRRRGPISSSTSPRRVLAMRSCIAIDLRHQEAGNFGGACENAAPAPFPGLLIRTAATQPSLLLTCGSMSFRLLVTPRNNRIDYRLTVAWVTGWRVGLWSNTTVADTPPSSLFSFDLLGRKYRQASDGKFLGAGEWNWRTGGAISRSGRVSVVWYGAVLRPFRARPTLTGNCCLAEWLCTDVSRKNLE